jgi:hypothetical protein
MGRYYIISTFDNIFCILFLCDMFRVRVVTEYISGSETAEAGFFMIASLGHVVQNLSPWATARILQVNCRLASGHQHPGLVSMIVYCEHGQTGYAGTAQQHTVRRRRRLETRTPEVTAVQRVSSGDVCMRIYEES